MATYTANLGLSLLEQNQSQPHVPLNDDMQIIDDATLGRFSFDFTSQPNTLTLTAAQARMKFLNFWGTGGGALTVNVPAARNIWIVDNYTGQNLTLKTTSGAGVVLPSGFTALLFCDGANVHMQQNCVTEDMRLVDDVDIILGTGNGSKIGTGTTQKLGFYGVTPIAQRSGSAQASVAGSAGASYTGAEQTIINNLVTLANELRAAAVALGLIKGSA